MRINLLAATLPLCLALATPPAAAANLAAHHATYTLSLDADKAERVIAATGSMSFDVTDRCTAWATAQHMALDITGEDGQKIHMVSDYTTLENKDGQHLQFHTRETTDGDITKQIDGQAVLEHPAGRGYADYTTPQKTRILLPTGTLFPMGHTAALIDAATTSHKFLSAPEFDGTSTNGAQDSFATIETWRPPAPQPFPALTPLPFGHIHIAFFDRTTDTQTPDYEIDLINFANGVANNLVMDFGGLTMDGVLKSLEIKAKAKC